MDMPVQLIDWSLDQSMMVSEQLTKQTVARAPAHATMRDDYVFDGLTEDIVSNILKQLPQYYLDNYTHWLKATTILKRHDMKGLWENGVK